jgi:hypothetical protein
MAKKIVNQLGFDFGADESVLIEAVRTRTTDTAVEGKSAEWRHDQGAGRHSGEPVKLGPTGLEVEILRAHLLSLRELPLVPHNVFLAWPVKQQLDYCAARDRQSHRETGDPWYAERARAYEEMARC